MKKKQKTLRESIEELSKEEMADLLEAYICLAPISLSRCRTLTGEYVIAVGRAFYDIDDNEVISKEDGEPYEQAKLVLEWFERD